MLIIRYNVPKSEGTTHFVFHFSKKCKYSQVRAKKYKKYLQVRAEKCILQKMFVFIGVGEKGGSGADDKLPINPTSDDKITDKLPINGKIETIYRYVMDNPHVTSDKVATYIGLSQESAKKYLRQLVALGYIIPEGANRNRTYSVKV